MAQVNSTDGVDEVLELFLNDMITSTIVPDPINAADGLFQPLLTFWTEGGVILVKSGR